MNHCTNCGDELTDTTDLCRACNDSALMEKHFRRRLYLDGIRIEGETGNGVLFGSELANSDGMCFYLFPSKDQDTEQAKSWLRHRRDVVRFRVTQLERAERQEAA
jgi:hypothetical protein